MMAQPEDSAQSKSEQFLGEDGNTPQPTQPTPKRFPKRERIKHILIGSPKVVTNTIHLLHALGYARVGDWSPLIPTDNPDEVMSIFIRQILIH